MVGITSYGAYIPKYRLSRDLIARAWGQRYLGGERAVANLDEDSFTMANEAAVNCLADLNPASVGAVYFASVSSPYIEKQASALIATTCDLSRGVETADFAGSVRASTAALKQAFQVAASTDQHSLVCAADLRPSEPGSDLEQFFGDAAAAVLVGSREPIATLLGSFSVSEEFLDSWRKRDDPFISRGDTAFVQSYGYQRLVKEAIKGLLAKTGVGVGEIAKLLLNALDPRSPQVVARSLEFADSQLADTLLSSVGDAGNASALLLLVHALEQARPGDRLLLCNYGSGNADAFLFQVTDAIEAARSRRGVGFYLGQRRDIGNYEKLLKFRGQVPRESIDPFASATLAWKEVKQNLKLLGQKCQSCGFLVYPRRHVCPGCGTRDQFDDVRLATRGKAYTFTKDFLYPSPDPPTAMVVADLEDGSRFYCQLTDCAPDNIQIGMPVELVLRRYHEGDGFVNYFWKFRPSAES